MVRLIIDAVVAVVSILVTAGCGFVAMRLVVGGMARALRAARS
ncbi:MAG TPA: hypothetical protein VN709_08615 [Terriglobales bacterium]|nr:hypothetical protein [Terriglobales bacterium]